MLLKKYLLQLSLLLMFVFLPILAFSQPHSSILKFEHLNSNTGLPFSTVNHMMQDSHGFIWFATSVGMFRYDGHKFKAFQNSAIDSNSIADNNIYLLYELSDGRILIAFYNFGYSIYNPETNSFHNFRNKNSKSNQNYIPNIRAVFEDSKKRIWMGSNKIGLLSLNKTTGKASKIKTQNLSNNITAICEDKKARIWLCDTLGISQYMPETNTAIRFNNISQNWWENVGGWDKKIFVDSQGDIWITTRLSGLYKFNPETKKFKQYIYDSKNPNSLTNNNVDCIMETDDKKLWFGTDGGGINIYNRQFDSFEHVQSNTDLLGSLMNNSIYSIFKDKTGLIWVATYRSGLNVYNPQKIKFNSYIHEKDKLNSLSEKQVLCVYQDAKERIWVGTDGNGLNLYLPEKGIFKRYIAKNQYPDSLHSNIIKTIYEAYPDQLWLGTYQNGLEIFDIKKNKFTHIFENNNDLTKITSNSIWSITANKEGNLWLAMLGRPINYYNKQNNTFKRFEQLKNNLPVNTTIIAFVDSKNRAWFATGAGILLYDNKTEKFLVFNKQSGLNSEDVQCIFEDSKKRMWIGTNGGGLNLFKLETKTFKAYGRENGLPSNTICSILEDKKGNLWISTANGMSKFNPEKNTFHNYDKTDGLPDNEFVYDCALKAKNGSMYFGSINGLLEFQPDSINNNSFFPAIYITDFLLFNEKVKPNDATKILSNSIEFTKEINLKYNQSVITFEFTALNYSNQNKTQYAFRLLGFDKKWNEVGNKHEATYTNIAPGEYEFQVKASNSDGVWNDKMAVLKISIAPPLWKQWYMYCLYILTIVLILRYLRNQIHIRERFKNQIRLDQLKAEKIEEINQEKMKFFTGISHEFRTPLTLIIDPLEKMMQKQDMPKANFKALVQIMHQNANRLLRLVNQLIDFRKLEEGKLSFDASENELLEFVKSVAKSFAYTSKERRITFNLNIPDQEIILFFDKNKLDNLLFNLLSNSFRYTPDGGVINLTISTIFLDNEPIVSQNEKVLMGTYVSILVSDTGIGIRPEKIQTLFNRFNQTDENLSFNIKGTGIGLSLVKEYVNMHKGYISVESEVNKGTKFTVLLPTIATENNKVVKSVELTISLGNPGSEKNEVVSLTPIHANAPIVLIVEDNKELNDYIRNELSGIFKVYTAENGQDGYEKAIEIVPDLIVSDLMMPIMNGVEMCRKLKYDEKTCHIPVVLLTAKSSNESREEGYSGGADVYLTKPFSIKVLTACLKNLLIQRKRLRELFQQNFISDTEVQSTNKMDEKFANKLNDIILKNIDNFDFNSEMLATELAVSRTVLFRKIKALTGQSASIYIRNFRLKKAAKMLQEKDRPVSEIALLTGFQQVSYFTKCFKEQYGKSPREFN